MKMVQRWMRNLFFWGAAAAIAWPHFFQVYADPDMWAHIQSGIEYLRVGSIKITDPFSYVTTGLPWINHEWLADCLWGIVFLAVRDQGLFLLRAFLFSGISAGLIWLCRRRWQRDFFILLIYLVAVPHISRFINVRPHGLSYFLIVIYLFCFEAYRAGKRKWLWLLPVLMLLWANLHAGFIFGLALAVFEFSELQMESRSSILLRGQVLSNDLSPKGAHHFLLILFLIFAATCVNPYGVEIFRYLYDWIITPHGEIVEWEPFLRQAAWRAALGYYALFTILPLITRLIAKDSRRTGDFLFFLLAAALTLLHRRFFILLVMFGPLIFSQAASVLWVKRTDSLLPTGLFLALLLPHSLSAAKTEWNQSGMHVRLNASQYPVKAMEFLKKNFYGPNLAVTFQWGGYAIWNLYPNYKVSADGRNTNIYPLHYIASYLEAYKMGDLKNFLGNYHVDAILIENGSKMDEVLNKKGEWLEIYRDGMSVIFLPRNANQGMGTPPML